MKITTIRMQYKPITDISDVVRKASLYKQISEEQLIDFKTNIKTFFGFIKKGQEERTQAGFLKTFLVNTYYKGKYLIVEEEQKKDFSIKGTYDINDKSQVFIETKKVDSGQMVHCNNLEARAFYETILYYMNERAGHNDVLKHIVITNMDEWCVIDALEYDRLFWRDKSFKNLYTDFIKGRLSYNTREDFYDIGIAEFVKGSKASIHYIYFNLRELTLTKAGGVKDNVTAILKLLSPSFMLKQYERGDGRQLNRGFYMELLHIMGLEEVDEENKKVIRRKTERNEGSLIENAIEQINTNPVSHLNVEGNTIEEKIFNAALQLSIIWINRLLFLKLLEAQLCNYHKGYEEEYRFLTAEKLKSYNDLDILFFRVLALPENERSQSIKNKYPHVPYLNSSLFEVDRLESDATRIVGLSNDAELPLYSSSVLRDYVRRNKQKLSSLEYLLLFLDSYNFGSDKNNEGSPKQLISASVLGLIFEKINGYKDGSIFTPPKITMLMCRQTLRKAVIDKFNIVKNDWHCADFTQLYNQINKSQNYNEANEIINSLKICDPAVGSGHFLVSALNELIAIKAELGIIIDKDGKTLCDYHIEVQNDELVITDREGVQMTYQRSLYYRDCQRVQEIIFHEKRTIIENCLFGVDINPNSVNICRLRLWIELLKNTYYDRDSGKLQTLPNIDINIQSGNSLVSKFPVVLGEPIRLNSQLAKKLKASINNYRSLVNEYKQNCDKNKREEIKKAIKRIRSQFLSSGELRWDTDTEVIDFKDPYHDSTEWMLLFPEVLDDEARFRGFDVVIGNPPYINMQKLGAMSKFYQKLPGRSFSNKTYKTYDASGDILTLFFELGRLLVREGGIVSYIVSNSWMRTQFGEKTRKFLSENTNPIFLVDFTGFKVFENVTVETNILTFERGNNSMHTFAANVNKDDYDNLDSFLEDNLIPCEFNTSDFWYILQPQDQRIRNQVVKVGRPLKDSVWGLEVNFGIKTGCNDAFLIDEEKYQELLRKCSTEKEREYTERLIQKVVRGGDIKRYDYEWAGLYLIATFPSRKHEINIYPAVRRHLETFAANYLRNNGYDWIADDENLLKEFCRKRLYQTGAEIKIDGKPILIGGSKEPLKARKRTSHNWFELQDSIAFWRDFSKPKLVWKRIGSDVRFAYDETGILTMDSTCIAIGNRVKYLCGVFNSKMGRYLLKYTPRTGTGDSLVSVQAFHPIYVPLPSSDEEKEIMKLVDSMFYNPSDKVQKEIDDKVFKLYDITDKDIINYIESTI